MGGIIKVSIKENNTISSVEMHTSQLLARYGSIEELLYKITIEELISDSEEGELSDLSSTDYGHVFIDRDSKKIFNLNSFSRLSRISLIKAINNNSDLKSLSYTTHVITGTALNPIKNVSNACHEITELPYFYVLQGCLNVSDRVSYCGKKDGNIVILQTTKERDAFKVSADFEDKMMKHKKEYSEIFIQFESEKWEVVELTNAIEEHVKHFNSLLEKTN